MGQAALRAWRLGELTKRGNTPPIWSWRSWVEVFLDPKSTPPGPGGPLDAPPGRGFRVKPRRGSAPRRGKKEHFRGVKPLHPYSPRRTAGRIDLKPSLARLPMGRERPKRGDFRISVRFGPNGLPSRPPPCLEVGQCMSRHIDPPCGPEHPQSRRTLRGALW